MVRRRRNARTRSGALLGRRDDRNPPSIKELFRQSPYDAAYEVFIGANMYTRLEIRASKFHVGLQILILTSVAVILPLVGWIEFGPGAAGDTSVNGNSILAFWIMRFVLAACFVAALIAIQHNLRLWTRTPILFILNEKGLTDRSGTYRAWSAFESANISKGTLYLRLLSETSPRLIVIEPNEIGFSTTDKIIEFLRVHAPPELSDKL